MSQKPIEFTANILKITRVSGKAHAQMVVSIPISVSSDVPMGELVVKLESTQTTLAM